MAIDPRADLYGTSSLHTHSRTNVSLCYSSLKGVDSVPIALNEPGSDFGVYWKVPGPGHAVTIGANRSGKGACSIIPALLTYYGSAVVIDPKAETLWATFQQRERLGQRFVVLDPWDEVNRRYGSKVGIKVPISKFNPLSVLDPKHKDFADEVAMLADAVIVPSGSDPHWPDSARELVGGLIAACVEGAPGVASFNNVRRLLIASDKDLENAVTEVVKADPDSLAGRKLRRFLRKEGEEVSKEIASIRSTAVTQTAIFDAATLLDAMETTPDAFNLAELATRRSTLYLVLPVDKLFTHGRWLRLMLALTVRAISSQPTPPSPPVLFILDELGTITPGTRGGGIPLVAQSSGLTAGLGIRLWCFFQDLNQMQRDYPESWGTFLANAYMVQVLRVNDNNTAQHFSDYLGSKTVTSGGGYSIMDLKTQETNYHQRPVKFPHEIMQMPVGQSLVMFSGGPYYQLTTVPYFAEPRFAGRYLQNPLHPPYVPPAPPPVVQSKTEKVVEAAGEWVRTDGKAYAEAAAKQAGEAATKAAEWARTDGAAHARAAAAAASEGAAKASKWLGAKWRDLQAKKDQPRDSEDNLKP